MPLASLIFVGEFWNPHSGGIPEGCFGGYDLIRPYCLQ